MFRKYLTLKFFFLSKKNDTAWKKLPILECNSLIRATQNSRKFRNKLPRGKALNWEMSSERNKFGFLQIFPQKKPYGKFRSRNELWQVSSCVFVSYHEKVKISQTASRHRGQKFEEKFAKTHFPRLFQKENFSKILCQRKWN